MPATASARGFVGGGGGGGAAAAHPAVPQAALSKKQRKKQRQKEKARKQLEKEARQAARRSGAAAGRAAEPAGGGVGALDRRLLADTELLKRRLAFVPARDPLAGRASGMLPTPTPAASAAGAAKKKNGGPRVIVVGRPPAAADGHGASANGSGGPSGGDLCPDGEQRSQFCTLHLVGCHHCAVEAACGQHSTTSSSSAPVSPSPSFLYRQPRAGPLDKTGPDPL